MKIVDFNAVVEGTLDEFVLRRIIKSLGFQLRDVYGKQGKGHIIQKISGYNNAAKYSPWIVLIDLNNDYKCPPELIRNCLPSPSKNMLLRIAVREVESWLIADRDRMASYLGIPVVHIPFNPDSEPDPKQVIVNLARRSKFSDMVKDIVPKQESMRRVGPAYTSRLLAYAEKLWRINIAARSSESLNRCIRAIRSYVASWT
jgi:hypothetical protein